MQKPKHVEVGKVSLFAQEKVENVQKAFDMPQHTFSSKLENPAQQLSFGESTA